MKKNLRVAGYNERQRKVKLFSQTIGLRSLLPRRVAIFYMHWTSSNLKSTSFSCSHARTLYTIWWTTRDKHAKLLSERSFRVWTHLGGNQLSLNRPMSSGRSCLQCVPCLAWLREHASVSPIRDFFFLFSYSNNNNRTKQAFNLFVNMNITSIRTFVLLLLYISN